MAGWVCVLGWIVLGPAAPSGRPNCGVEAVAAMSVALGHPLAEVEVHGLIDAWPAAEVSLLDVQQMAERVRLPLTGVRATLDELLDGHTPCIVHLEAPDHFAVLLDGHERTLRFLAGRGGGVSLFARTETEARYSGAALILPAPAAAPAPRIRFDTTWSEFGVTGTGQTVSETFTFHNEGALSLFVDPKARSCSCTSVVEGEQTIPPGGSGAITVRLRVDSLGAVDEHVAVATSDPARPVVVLSLHGRTVQGLRTIPAKLTLWTEPGLPRTRTFEVVGPPGLIIKGLFPDAGICEARVAQQSVSQRQARFTIEFGLTGNWHRDGTEQKSWWRRTRTTSPRSWFR